MGPTHRPLGRRRGLPVKSCTLVNASTCWKAGAPRFHRHRVPVLRILPDPTFSTYLFIWLFISILHNKLVNIVNVSLSSVSHSSKLIEPQEGTVGISDLLPVGRKHR